MLRHLNTTSIGEAVKTFGTEFWNFYHKGSFFQKTQKMLTKFQGLATSVRHKAHNFATITVRHKFTTKLILYGCLVSIFTVRINWKSFPWAVPRMGPGYRLCSSPVHSLPHRLLFITFTFFFCHSLYLFSSIVHPTLSTRIVPLRFQAWGRKRRPNLGLACFVLWLCYLYCLVKIFLVFCCIWFSLVLRCDNCLPLL